MGTKEGPSWWLRIPRAYPSSSVTEREKGRVGSGAGWRNWRFSKRHPKGEPGVIDDSAITTVKKRWGVHGLGSRCPQDPGG